MKTLKIAGYIWSAIRAILLGYAVLFSIAGTLALIPVWKYVGRPVLDVVRLKTSNPEKTAYMRQYEKTAARQGVKEIKQQFVPLDSISMDLQEAVLAAEDDAFYTHPGIDLNSLVAAMQYNQDHGVNKRGASTISQQMAKNLFLSNEKSFSRKYRELAYTLLMETILGKKRILELYLNYAQWGKDVFGCEAASRKYFRKPASKLTPIESARMAAVLAKPAKLNPLSTSSVFMQKRLQVIANNIYLRHHPVEALSSEEGSDSSASGSGPRFFFESLFSRDSSAITDPHSREQ